MSTRVRVVGKAGVLGAVIGSFSCTACFPAIGSIGTAIGLGFLGQWEGLAVRFLIPIFVMVVLIANLVGWAPRHRWHRALVGCVGPGLALLGAFGLMGVFGLTHGFLPAEVARGSFYVGLTVMVVAALWDLLGPANHRCRTNDFVASAKTSSQVGNERVKPVSCPKSRGPRRSGNLATHMHRQR